MSFLIYVLLILVNKLTHKWFCQPHSSFSSADFDGNAKTNRNCKRLAYIIKLHKITIFRGQTLLINFHTRLQKCSLKREIKSIVFHDTKPANISNYSLKSQEKRMKSMCIVAKRLKIESNADFFFALSWDVRFVNVVMCHQLLLLWSLCGIFHSIWVRAANKPPIDWLLENRSTHGLRQCLQDKPTIKFMKIK